MERTLNRETIKCLGEKVKVCGWVQTIRSHGKIVFIDLRDRSGILQVVCSSNLVEGIKEEYALAIEGTVQERPKEMINPKLETGIAELKAEKVEVLAEALALPFDLKKLNLSLPKLLDFRPLTLRNEKIQAIFKIQEQVMESFRNTLKNLGFTEFQSPMIVPSNAEGGAQVFHIDYYDYDAYLAQSPQLYKQIMVGGFERAFTITHVFRAEPSVTTRHISEYTSLDAEMGFISSWEDLLDVCEIITRDILSGIQKNCQKELKIFDATVPQVDKNIPRLKMREVQKIIFDRTGKDNRNEPDLEPEDEKEICKFAKEKHGSELVFVTHYPTKKRPFYTYPDPEDPEYTLSFDLLCRGLEIVTGGQRIHEYKKLLENIKKWKNNPKDFSFYLQTFKYGMPPEGGFAFGLERIVKQILGLENIREACVFPRDMERIDQRLSLLQPRTKTSTLAKDKSKKKKS